MAAIFAVTHISNKNYTCLFLSLTFDVSMFEQYYDKICTYVCTSWIIKKY